MITVVVTPKIFDELIRIRCECTHRTPDQLVKNIVEVVSKEGVYKSVRYYEVHSCIVCHNTVDVLKIDHKNKYH